MREPEHRRTLAARVASSESGVRSARKRGHVHAAAWCRVAIGEARERGDHCPVVAALNVIRKVRLKEHDARDLAASSTVASPSWPSVRRRVI